VSVRYLHSEIETLERIKIIRDLRLGSFDVLVGVNLLREGLDLPEVSLVAILDADKEGFLRSETSLVQTAGRAARNINGRVIFYADRITDSMARAIGETERRRKLQLEFNQEHGITPESIIKPIDSTLLEMAGLDYYEVPVVSEDLEQYRSAGEIDRQIEKWRKSMKEAAMELDFESAAQYRDKIRHLELLRLSLTGEEDDN